MTYPYKKKSGINNAQKALLHTAKRELGLDDATYRTMLQSIAGVKSSTDLTLLSFQAVMQHLADCGFKKTPGEHNYTGFAACKKKWEKLVGERPTMATPAQLARIETDWDMMRWYWTRPNGFGNKDIALRGILKKIVGVSDLRFLGFDQAGKTIEALKAICARREKVAGDSTFREKTDDQEGKN